MHCPKCKTGIIAVDSMQAELYCQRCGAVIEEQLVDMKDGLFEFDPENAGMRRPTRETTSWMHPYKGFSNLSRAKNDLVEESYANAYPTFEILWGALRLPTHVRAYTGLLWRRCYKARLTRGRLIEPLAAAITHIAYTDMGMKRALEEAASAVDADHGTAERYFSMITKALNLKNTPFRIKTIDAIEKIAGDLGLDTGITYSAIIALDGMIGKGAIGRRKPNVVAAAAVYKAAKENKIRITQEALAKAISVSGRGIRRTI